MKSSVKNLKRTWANNTGIHVATLSVFSLTLVVICGFLLIFKNTSRLIEVWGDSQQLSVYFYPEAKKEEVEKFVKSLKSQKEVKSYQVVSKKKAMAVFQKQLRGMNSKLLDDKEIGLAVPTTVLVSLQGEGIDVGNLSAFTELRKIFKKQKGVEEVSFGHEWIERYIAFLKILKIGGWSLIGLLFVVGIFVISNSIRVSVNARREDIEIMELVGSTQSMIRRPFVAEGASLGFLGGVVGVLFTYAGYSWLVKLMVNRESFSQITPYMSFLSVTVVLYCLLMATFTGALASYLCVRKVNDGWAARGRRA